MIYMNCRNHRLALVLVHMMKCFPFIANVDSVLEGLWKLFHYSPQKNEVLKEAKIVEVSTTRWLTHGEGCIRLLERFSQVLDALDSIIASKNCPTSIGLRKLLRLLERFSQVLDALDSIIASKNCPTSIGLRILLLKPNTLKGLLVLADVLKILNFLSRLLQEKNLPFTKVSAKVSRVKERIHDSFKGQREDS